MLLILSCSETKRAPATRRAPFANVYDGPMWRQVKAAGFPLSSVAAISALYGFLEPGAAIELYNVKMDEERSRRIIGEGDHIARLAKAIAAAGRAHVFGGALYQEIVRAAIRYRPELERMVTFARGSFLEQRKQLGEFLLRSGGELAVSNPHKMEKPMKTPQVAPMPGMSPLGFKEPSRATNEKTIAERKWSAPLKPKAEQKACDAGLFSDDSKQTELKL